MGAGAGPLPEQRSAHWEGAAQAGGEPGGQAVEGRPLEDRGPEAPGPVLGGQAAGALAGHLGVGVAVGGFPAQAHQDLGNGDLHGADLAAGPAEAGAVDQVVADAHALHLRREDLADGAGVDRLVGVASHAGVDGAVVHAGAAADAAQRGAQLGIRVDAGAAIVQDHQVDFLRAILLVGPARSGDQVEVGADGLARGRAREDGVERGHGLQVRHHLLQAHDGDVQRWHVGAHAAVAFVLHQTEGPGLGHREVHAGEARVGLQELLPQHLPGHGRELVHILGVLRILDLLAELPGDLVFVLMDGRHDDVARRLPVELDDVLAQVGLDGLDAVGLQEGVEVHLLGDHALALDQGLGAPRPQQAQDQLVGLLAGLGPVHLDAVLRAAGLQLLEQLWQAQEAAGADGGAQVAQLLQVPGVRELGLALADEAIHGAAEVGAELGVQQGRGGGLAEEDLALSVHGCAPTGTRRCAGRGAGFAWPPGCRSH